MESKWARELILAALPYVSHFLQKCNFEHFSGNIFKIIFFHFKNYDKLSLNMIKKKQHLFLSIPCHSKDQIKCLSGKITVSMYFISLSFTDKTINKYMHGKVPPNRKWVLLQWQIKWVCFHSLYLKTLINTGGVKIFALLSSKILLNI